MTETEIGSLNLLLDCVGLKPGEHLLLVEEEPREKLYSPALTELLALEAGKLGAVVSRAVVALQAESASLPDSLVDAMDKADHALFVNRIADFRRFRSLPGSCSKTLCYALDTEMLGSRYAGVSHKLMTRLLTRLEQQLMSANSWRITCPLGTDIAGTFCWPSRDGEQDDEFSLALFPVTTFKPVPCNTASGIVKLSRWLIPGGAAKVEPALLRFDDVVTATVCGGLLDAVDGPRAIKRRRDRSLRPTWREHSASAVTACTPGTRASIRTPSMQRRRMTISSVGARCLSRVLVICIFIPAATAHLVRSPGLSSTQRSGSTKRSTGRMETLYGSTGKTIAR